ncbi:acetamidase/formamidase family protein [Heyndrickxia vini]|uniref:Acetamidase/formamidase family protein n=1 Tax=Heyndrickxia vini TaxID=1476025 RepID=A0ABX7DYD7_9BACI|nr:acetamidase/formamidase family protein [Heyndrickxia vini]QQZ08115.1 acetamidase/formamidase family protein [Heyndrickxia vini]
MKTFQKEQSILSFSSLHQPAYTVDLGETFSVETFDCYGGVITSAEQLRPNMQIDYINPATGPIFINNLKKGETLVVDIEDIQLDKQGVMVLYPGMGPLGELVKETDTKIFHVENGKILFNEFLELPIKPMIGVIGTAPLEGDVLCESPGDHGGNMDTKYITIGSKVYLPVYHDGGMLALGDLHASMGDGELDGSGIEIGGKVTMTVSKIHEPIPMPIVETAESFMYISSAESIEQASNKGMEAVVSLFEKKLSLSFNDAYRLLSAVCDLQISQIVNPLVTVRIVIPKTVVSNIF